MDINKLPLFRALTERMNWLGQRQEVLAQNVANLNTPGYRPSDLKESDFAAALGQATSRLTLSSSQGASIGTAGTAGGHYKAIIDPDAELSPSGNGVSLEDQLMKVADTQADYQTAASLYKKHLLLIKMALGGR
jgi:flagellar basal-body rod protein FlgB